MCQLEPTCASLRQCLEAEPDSFYYRIVSWRFCMESMSGIVLFYLIMTLTLGILFLLMTTMASKYLCPNLSLLCEHLTLPPTVAGVTLLAFGNGSPDMFTTFAAFTSNTPGLALGGLFGAIAYLCLFVVGWVVCMGSFQLPRRPFYRDTLFLMGAMSWMMIMAYKGSISLSIGLSMIGYYGVYVGVVIVGRMVYQHMKQQALYDVASVEIQVDQEMDQEQEPFLLETTPLMPRTSSSPYLPRALSPSPSFIESRSIASHSLSHSPSVFQEDRGLLMKYWPHATAQGVFLGPSRPVNEALISTTWADHPLKCLFMYFMPKTAHIIEDTEYQEKRYLIQSVLSDIGLCVFECTVYQPSRLFGLTSYEIEQEQQEEEQVDLGQEEPIRISRNSMASLTTSALEKGRKWIVFLQSCLVPLVCTWMAIKIEFPVPYLLYLFPILIALGLKWIPLTSWTLFLSLLGTAQSIAWIAFLSRQIVVLLRATAYSLGWSEWVIGLIVVANANSLGDLVTNRAVARMGLPAMAVGACFGSPIMNLVLGVGISSTYVTWTRGQDYSLTGIPSSFYISGFFLLACLFLIQVWVTVSHYYMHPQLGALMILLYGVFILLNMLSFM